MDFESTGCWRSNWWTRGTSTKSVSLQHRNLETNSWISTPAMELLPPKQNFDLNSSSTSDFLHCLGQVGEAGLGIAVQHPGYRLKKERILKAGKPLSLPSF